MENQNVNEEAIQQWTVFFKKELSKITERLDAIEKQGAINEEIEVLKRYVKNLKAIQEKSLDWQGDIAKALNKVASYADSLAEKNNQHYFSDTISNAGVRLCHSAILIVVRINPKIRNDRNFYH
mgnify:CR=1 FL=1